MPRRPNLTAILPRRLVLADIGARGGLQWPWNAMEEALQQVLFEPDPQEAERLRRAAPSSGATVIGNALWARRESLSLHITRDPGCSSVFRPNLAQLQQFPESERFVVERVLRLDADTVDDLVRAGQLAPPDAAKIDTQGSELPILRGAIRTFQRELVALELEVEFLEMYHDQPLFADVDAFVRGEIGLELWDIRKTYWKYQSGVGVGAPKGRLIFGDALYFRPLESLESWLHERSEDAAREKLLMLSLSALAYGYADYALAVCDFAAAQRLLVLADVDAWQSLIRRSAGTGFRPLAHGSARFYAVLDTLARSFRNSHHGWATVGGSLGSKRIGPFWR